MTPAELLESLRDASARWEASPDANQKTVLRRTFEGQCWHYRALLLSVLAQGIINPRGLRRD